MRDHVLAGGGIPAPDGRADRVLVLQPAIVAGVVLEDHVDDGAEHEHEDRGEEDGKPERTE